MQLEQTALLTGGPSGGLTHLTTTNMRLESNPHACR